MSSILPVKGTRDFYPEDMAFRQWLYAKIRAVSEEFGYQEYDGPFLERLDLYAAKSGEELVNEQSFVFEDRGGEMIALRPELTPSLARMVATRGQQLPRLLRWWSFGPFWRYERPQKGRSREFFQWNIDLLGVDSPEADAEIAAIGAAFLRSVGLGPTAVRILVNDRRLADSQLAEIGIEAERRPQVFRIIDRRDRMPTEEWRGWATVNGLSKAELEGLIPVLDDKAAWQSSQPLQRFFAAAGAMGAGDYLAYDPSVIRGLDYYTGVVLEARDVEGEFRAIFGGGRYDDLVSAVGGDPVPATGFAMGDMVVGLVIDKYGSTPKLDYRPANILVTTFDDDSMPAAIELAAELRAAGLPVEWYPLSGKLGKQLKYADRVGATIALILGPEEISAGQVTIRNLHSGDQVAVARTQVVDQARSILGTDSISA